MATKKARPTARRKKARKAPRRAFLKSIYRDENLAVLAALREVRERAGLTQGQLAERLGRTQNYVHTLERGTRADTIQLYDWCLACGTTLSAWIRLVERELQVRDFPIKPE